MRPTPSPLPQAAATVPVALGGCSDATPPIRQRRTGARGTNAAGALALAALAVLLPVAAGAQASDEPIRPAGAEREATASEPCTQAHPDIAPLAGGGSIAVWTGGVGAPRTIGARRLDRAGAPLGEEIVLRDFPPGHAGGPPRVAPAADGGFVVAWTESAFPQPELRILLQRFEHDGTPEGPPVEVATTAFTSALTHALATDAEGRPAVTWSNGDRVGLRLFDSDLTPRSEAIEVADSGAAGLRAGSTAVIVHPHPLGELLVVWEEAPLDPLPGPVPPPRFDRVRGRLFNREEGTPSGDPIEIHRGPVGIERSLSPAVASLPSFGYVVTWAGLPAAEHHPPQVQARLVDGLGQLPGDVFRVDAGQDTDVFDPDVVGLPDDRFAIAWSARLPAPPVTPLPPGYQPSRIGRLRLLDPPGSPRGPPIVFGEGGDGLWHSTPAAALAADTGRLTVLWRDHDPIPIGPPPPPPCPEQSRIFARDFYRPCREAAGRLCLVDRRFAVEVTLDDPRLGPPLPRPAIAAPLSDDTGTFWFFRPENVELMVKLVDGRTVNDRFWFFNGSLSNLGHEIVVVDTVTGTERRYRNAPGELASRFDGRAFADLESSEPAADAGEAVGFPAGGGTPPRPLAGATHPEAPCSDPHLLCLFGERFAARVEWRDPRTGATGTAIAEPLTDRSGTFWFFRPDNREIVFKMLDGRSVNSYFWVFFGGLTDLEYTITVEDRVSHTSWSYDNPPFRFTSHADVHALAGFPCHDCNAGGAMTRSAEGDAMP